MGAFASHLQGQLTRPYGLDPGQVGKVLRESPFLFLRPFMAKGHFLDRGRVGYAVDGFHDHLMTGVSSDSDSRALVGAYQGLMKRQRPPFPTRLGDYFNTLRDVLARHGFLSLPARPKDLQFLLAGGTITMTGALYRRGIAGAGLLARQMSALEAAIRIFGDLGVDSSVMGPHEWERIVESVCQHAVKKGCGGLLLHGTDTLEQTSLLLSLLFNGYLAEPIVLTGSAKPPDQPDSDAISNLTNGYLVAKDPKTPPLVYVVIGKEIHLGSRVKKVNRETSYFTSAGGPVGVINDDGTITFKNDFLAWAKKFQPRFAFNLDRFSTAFVDIAVHPEPDQAFRDLMTRVRHRPDRLGILVYGIDEWEGLRRKTWAPYQGLEHFLAEEFPHAFFLPECEIPAGLDPVRAALKLSIVRGRLGRSEVHQLMKMNLSGEVVHSHAFDDLSPPKNLPPGVEVLYATQTMDPESIRQAAQRLSQHLPPVSPPERVSGSEFAAIRRSHPILEAIADAVDMGVEVVMATSAFQAATHLEEYEIGAMIALMGARDSGGKNFRELCREGVDHPRLIIVGTGSGHLPIGARSREERVNSAAVPSRTDRIH